MRAVGGARVVMEKRMPLLPMSTRACRCVAAYFRGDGEVIFEGFLFLTLSDDDSWGWMFPVLVVVFLRRSPVCFVFRYCRGAWSIV
jgi:hypothetical protein